MAIQAQLADGRILEFPDGTDPAVIQATVKRMVGEQPAETAGIGEAAIGGAKRYLSRGLTALESLIGDTGEAARAGVARQQAITERPGASLEAVKQAYERGLLPAAGEVLSQAPAALAEQGFNIGATLTGARLGAMAGTAVAPGIGTAIGAIGGALVPNLLQLFSENIERQSEEGKDVSAGRALLAATPGAALETAGGLIPFGKFLLPSVLGKEAGRQVQKLLSRGQIKAAENLANETVAKSVAKGIPLGAGVEGATEAAQAMLSRWQAGLPLFNDEAFQEYGENAYGGALVGGTIGGASRPLGRGAAAKEAEAIRTEEETRDRIEAQRKAEATRAQFEGERKPLALPAPAERAIPAKVPMELENAGLADESLVKFKLTELTPDVRKYVEESRANKGLPRLKSYTIEDIQDSMPGIDPKGERAALNSILASKTGFDRFVSEGIKPTSALVLKEAENKNIDTQSQGFNDFLKRTTGQSELGGMTPVELYTAYNSLQQMPRMAGEGTQSLPTGSAASRFTEKQYDTALSFIRMTLRDLKTDRLNVGEVVREIKDATGLETDKDAETLLNTALRNGELEQKERKVYRVLNKDTGELSLPIDKEAVAIRRANQMKNGTVQTEQFYEVGMPDIVTARKDMPEGYEMYLEDVADKDVPEGYEIVQEGKTRPLATQTTEEAAQKQADRIQKRNERRITNLNKKIQGQQGRIAKAQAVVDDLAARGMGDTAQAKVAQTRLGAETRDANAQIDNFQKEIDAIAQPISLRPTRKKIKTTRSRIILRKGDKDIGFFPNKEAATQAMLADMSDAELDAFEDQMSQQEFAGRPRPATAAKAARERASRRKPGIEVRTAEKAAPDETPQQRDERLNRAKEKFAQLGIDSKDRQEVLNELKNKLQPLLNKLGLGRVGFKVVSGLEFGADAEYDAAKNLISLSLESDNPIQDLRHEAIHALKILGFFTKSQWAALERKAKSEWIDKYLKNVTSYIDGRPMTRYDAYKNVLKLNDTAIMEEAIADAFGDFDVNGAPPGMMAAIMKRLKAFFEALRNGLNGTGFQTAEQIFKKADLNELRPSKVESQTEINHEAFSLKKGKPVSDIGHKREASTGRYVGAPEWVGSSPQQLRALRTKLRQLAKEGERGRYWYENSSKAILDMFRGDKKEAEKFVGLIAIYSPNATVAANTSMALQAYYQYKSGLPIKAGLPDGNRKATDLLVNNKPWSGIKTNSFYQNLMVAIDPSQLNPGVATMDMWMALSFDYGMKALDQGPKYQFAEREIQNLAKELGWDAHQVQAAIWTAIKGRIDPIRGKLKAKELELGIGEIVQKTDPKTGAVKDIYQVKPDRRFDHFKLAHKMGMEAKLEAQDINTAKYDFSDALNERSVQLSYEATPGRTTGVLPGIFAAPTSQKADYLKEIVSAMQDKSGNDIIAGWLGLPFKKDLLGFSAWEAEIGAGAQLFAPAPLQGQKDKRTFSPEAKQMLDLYSAIKGYVLNQEAVVYHVPVYDGALKNQNGIDVVFKQPLSEAEMNQLYTAINKQFDTWELAPGYTDSGVRVLNFTDINNRAFQDGMVAALETLPDDFAGGIVDFNSYRSEGNYIFNDWTTDTQGEGYVRQIEGAAASLGETERKNIFDGIEKLRTSIKAVNEKFGKKYGWDKPVSGKQTKLSLRKVYFETANEAENAVEEAGIPDTLEFALFYGGSSLRENDNTPIPMYHGASAVIDVFRDDKPIFVSPNARFAEDFAVVRSDETGLKPKIYPVWVRTETTFDYGNPEHRADVIAEVISNRRKPDDPVRQRPVYLERSKKWYSIEDIDEDLSNGLWSTIEDPAIQRAIRKLGHDGFIVREAGQDNLAVFSPNQLKSITGNEGQFSRGDPDIKFSLGKTIKDSPEFRAWFKQSKAVDANGSPVVLYHGTKADITKFWTNLNIGRNKFYGGELGSWFGSEADVANLFAEKKGSGASVYPVYLSLQNPYVFDDYREFNRFVEGRKSAAAVRRELQQAGYDGVIIRDSITDTGTKRDDYVAFKPEQIKSVFNAGAFNPKNPDIRYSLGKKMTGMPQIDKSIDDAVNKKIASRSAATIGERVTQAITPKTVSVIRQQLLNRYQGISDVVKRLQQKRAAETGMDVSMIGEENAENLALLSDLGSGVVASAFGIKGRPGGHVVYRNGAITVDNTKKGLGEIFAPLAKYKDPNVFRYYQYWAGAKRGVRLMGEGREKLFDQSDVARAKELEAKFPEFVQVQKDFVEFNNSLVDTMVKSGVISKEQGNAWVQHADYVPFYRQMENGETTIGPNVFQSMSTVKQPKKLKGGEGQLGDFFESVVRNTKAAVESSLKNNAARAALKAAVELGEAVKLTGTDANLTGPTIVRYFENGQRVAYEAKDSLFVASMSSLHMADIPFLGIISKPADLLRNLVTKDPGFMMANLLRDSMSAWVTSGEKMTPIAGSVASFAKALANKNPTVQALLNAGVIGGYEFSGNVMDSGRQFERDLERKAGKGSKTLRVASSVWDALEKGTTASDAATRALVYDRVLAETGNEVEALAKSLEVMNFNRKGANAAVRILTAAVPFLNARMQGLDLFYRVGISPSLSKPLTGAAATAAQRARQKTFFIRGGTIMALSAMYYVAVAGTDEYEDQEQETRDNNWIIGGARIPIPFEVGVLFKVVPERIMALTFGSDTGQDFQKSMQRAIVSTFAFNPIPQTFKPMVEVAANYSFFTGRPIIGQGMQDVDPRFQVSPGTTRGAEALGKALGVSPIKIDHLYKGYTGTMGMYLADVVDSVLDLFGDSPKPSRRFEQLPVIKRFIADPEARGKVTQFYELKRAVDVFVRTSNMLEKSMKPEDWEKYVTENMAMFGVASYVRSIEKQLAESRQMAQMVRNMSASPDEKRDLLTEIGRYEKSLVQNIQEVKKLANQ